jgi:hypothetical protein
MTKKQKRNEIKAKNKKAKSLMSFSWVYHTVWLVFFFHLSYL